MPRRHRFFGPQRGATGLGLGHEGVAQPEFPLHSENGLDQIDEGGHQRGVRWLVERAPEGHPDLEHQVLELADAQLLALPSVQVPEPASGAWSVQQEVVPGFGASTRSTVPISSRSSTE
jgi:hypothetical protein